MSLIAWMIIGVHIACFVINAVIVLGPDMRKWRGGRE